MSENTNKDLLKKIQKRAERSLKVQEVNLNSELYNEAVNYLKKQKYIKFLKINKVLANSFISDYPFGYVVKDHKNNIVGFMGTIFSKKIHNSKEYVYCNIHSWIVDKSYRINSFLLLTPLIEKKITLTAFTPVRSLFGLLEKFGFKKININYKVVCSFKLLFLKKNNKYTLEKNETTTRKKLNEDELRIYENYYKLPYEKFIITNNADNTKNIFVIASKIKKKGIKILNFFYISNISEFKISWHKFKSEISKEFRVNFFCQHFFNDSDNALPNNIFLSRAKKKDIFVKNILPDTKLDVLYSDLIE